MACPGPPSRPARPATWHSSWNVRSAHRKSGRCRPRSARMAPTRLTRGRSRPLATICVPTRTSASPRAKLSISASWAARSRAASWSHRSTRATEGLLDLLDDALRADAQVPDARAPAVGTARRLGPATPAVVADHALADGVVGERRVAAPAAQDVAAVPALHDARRATPVQEEDGLLPALEGAGEGLVEAAAEDAAHAGLELLPHVDDLCFRQRDRAGPAVFAQCEALGQLQESMPPLAGVMVRGEVRRGAAQHDGRSGELGELQGYVPRVVPGGNVLLLVRPLVLLVEDDEAQVRNRGEHRAAESRGRRRSHRGGCATTHRTAGRRTGHCGAARRGRGSDPGDGAVSCGVRAISGTR